MSAVIQTTACPDMQAYIAHTKYGHRPARFYLSAKETAQLYELAVSDPFSAIVLAFEYGKAKGFRAAKVRAGE